MKKQTGIWVDAQTWQAYRILCNREKLRPAEPLEKFIRFILRDGSALSIMNWLENVGRAEGLEAYARVLLNWYKNGTYWIMITDEDEAPIQPMLLSALKEVPNPELRREIEDALTIKPAQGKAEPSKAQIKAEEEISETIAGLKGLVKGKSKVPVRRSLVFGKSGTRRRETYRPST